MMGYRSKSQDCCVRVHVGVCVKQMKVETMD